MNIKENMGRQHSVGICRQSSLPNDRSVPVNCNNGSDVTSIFILTKIKDLKNDRTF